MRTLYRNFRWGLTGEPQQMLVEDGRVVSRQAVSDARHSPIATVHLVDLQGALVLPAFIDSHCHILPTGLDLAKLHLGACRSREEVLDAVLDRHKTLPEGEWLHAVHYDQNRFADGLHLSRDELDSISGERPILLRHSNGHASVANSAALRVARIAEEQPDPKGGTFVRDSGGRLTGVLLEKAHEKVTAAAPMPSLERMVEAILAAGEKMAELGIVSATDMMTGVFDLAKELEAYRIALERGCRIRIRLWLQWSSVLGHKAVSKEVLGRFKHPNGAIRGLKIFADGAIGSATAAIYGKFLTTGESGQLIYSQDRLNEMVRKAHMAGWPVAVHSIGDRSTDAVMDALEAAGPMKGDRIEHAMMLSDAQIERLAKLGVAVTMQPEFIRHFANSYRRQLPPSDYSKLERFRSVLKAGIPLALNSDRPITPGDPWVGIETACARPEGFDPSENLTREEALLAYTKGAAEADGDPGEGTLGPGSRCESLCCSNDPLLGTPSKVVLLTAGG